MKLRPLDDRVLVKPDEPEKVTTGGILLPKKEKQAAHRGTVMAVGPGKTLDSGRIMPVSVKKGDSVVFGSFTGNEIEIDRQKYLFIRSDDLLAICPKK